METWYNSICPFCNKHNFWCNGDESDLTRPDVDAVTCWSCKKVWLLEDNSMVNEDDYFYEDGKKYFKQEDL